MSVDLKAFNMLTEFWGIIRELNPEAIEHESRQRFSILVIGPDDESNHKIADVLTGGQPALGEVVKTANVSDNGNARQSPRADLYLYALPDAQVTDVSHAHKISAIEVQGKPVVLVICNSGNRSNEEILSYAEYTYTMLPAHRIVAVKLDDAASLNQKLVPAVIASLSHLHLALGRTLPAFRDPIASNLVLETSRVNAEFALLSSLPANIPVVGELFATGADMLVLTKNQVMLVLKLAALYGRSHNSRRQTLAEIVPVVGGAFLWRTTARTLVGLLPGIVAALPKTLIAFSGTFAVGNIARYYYAFGRKPNRKTLERFYDDALVEARSFLSIKRG